MLTESAHTVRVHLPAGDPNGIRIADIVMSKIQAIAFPYGQLRHARRYSKFHSFDKPGIYILIGSNELEGIHSVAYIGQSINVGGQRLYGHSSDTRRGKGRLPFWEHTVVLTTNDESISAGNLNYIEAELINRARRSFRWKLKNKNNRSVDISKLPPIERDAVDKFVNPSIAIIRCLGWDLFHEIPDNTVRRHKARNGTRKVIESPPDDILQAKFICRGSGGILATMMINEVGNYIVLKGSRASSNVKESAPRIVKSLHQVLIKNRILVEDGKDLIFSRNFGFRSISVAASIVTGVITNGRFAWKTDDGRNYDTWQDDMNEIR